MDRLLGTVEHRRMYLIVNAQLIRTDDKILDPARYCGARRCKFSVSCKIIMRGMYMRATREP